LGRGKGDIMPSVIEALDKSEFMLTLGKFGAQTIKDTVVKGPYSPDQIRFTLTRPLRADEEYVHRTLLSAGELVTVCDQMVCAIEFLSGFRKRRMASGGLLTRLDYLVYYLEDYFIRVGMIMDRALQVVNVVFRLGIPEKECRFAVVAMNEHVSHTQVARCLQELEGILKPYRGHRNIIIHRCRYTDKGINKIELFYALEKANLDEKDANLTAEFYPLYKMLTDKEVHNKKAELSDYSRTVFDQLGRLFAELLPIFNENRAKLTA
jgi:hypothetical protein